MEYAPIQPYPRTYRPSGAWTTLLLGCTALLTDAGATGAWYCVVAQQAYDPQSRMILGGIAILLLGLGLCTTVCIKRTKLVLLADRIEIHKLTSTEVLFCHEIERWSLLPAHFGLSYLHLIPRNQQRRQLKVPWIFKRDPAFDQWTKTLPEPGNLSVTGGL